MNLVWLFLLWFQVSNILLVIKQMVLKLFYFLCVMKDQCIWKYVLINNFWYFEKIIFLVFLRGFYLIIDNIIEVLLDLKRVEIGVLYLWLQYMSVSLMVNENVDFIVRVDIESFFNYIVKENLFFYRYIYEGSDDMLVYLKLSILGCQVIVFVEKGKFLLGIWQGIMLGEYCNYGGLRRIIVIL